MQEFKPKIALVQVSGNILPEDYEKWKRSGMRFAHVFRLGLMNAEQTPGYISRVRELEEGNLKLQKHVTYLYEAKRELEAQMQKLREATP